MQSGTIEIDLHENEAHGFHEETIIENVDVLLKKEKNSIHVLIKQEKKCHWLLRKKIVLVVNENSPSNAVKEIDTEKYKNKSMEYKYNTMMPEENRVDQQMSQISSQSNQAKENDITSENISESSPINDTSVNSEKIETKNYRIPPLVTDSAFKELDTSLDIHQPVDSSSTTNIDEQCDTSEQQNNSKMKYQEILKQNQTTTDPEQDKMQDILLSGIDTVQENQNKMKMNLQSQTILRQKNEKENTAALKQRKITNQNQLKDINELPATDHNKMYVLLALAFGACLLYIMSILSDNKSMKIQLDRALISIEGLNIKIRAINAEKLTVQDKLHEALTQPSDNIYHTEIIRITSDRDSLKIKVQETENQIRHIQSKLDQALTANNYLQAHAKETNPLMNRITSERDSLKIKVQEAENQIKHKQTKLDYALTENNNLQVQIRHIQTKLDYALTENNNLQAHYKEANPLMNKNSPEKGKGKKDPSDWISSWQSWMSYILNIPIYLLFSFQTTFLNLGCSGIFTEKFSNFLLKIPALRLRCDKPSVYKLLYFSCCILGYPVACELSGFIGWMTGFSFSKTNMLNIPKPIGLMVRSGSDIVSDWMLKDNALILWLMSISTGGIITFISYMWYDVLNKRLRTAGVKETHIVFFMICTLVLLNHSLYRISAWLTGVIIGPITFVNWLGARKAVSSLLSLIAYSIVALLTLKLFHVNASNLVRSLFQIIQKLLSNA